MKLPVNFGAFLQDASNKEELFSLLTEDVAACDYPGGKEIYITSGQQVISKGTNNPMPASDHQEADTRMCLHVADAASKGAKTIMVSTVDTDVVVILTGIFEDLIKLKPELHLWVAFGKGKHFKWFHINTIFMNLGRSKARALPFFHAFTGCDTTSQFSGRGKKSCWETWNFFSEATESFLHPVTNPCHPLSSESREFKVIEQFTCLMYDRNTSCEKVNDLRKDLFPRKVQMMQNLPPTQAALIQHTNRSIYQASIWSTSLLSIQNIPEPDNFGWTFCNNKWEPLWTTLPEAAKSCRQLIRCGCRASPLCSRRCKCQTTGLKCTAVFQCQGNCTYGPAD